MPTCAKPIQNKQLFGLSTKIIPVGKDWVVTIWYQPQYNKMQSLKYYIIFVHLKYYVCCTNYN